LAVGSCARGLLPGEPCPWLRGKDGIKGNAAAIGPA